MTALDPMPYLRLPVLNVAEALDLARALLATPPLELPPAAAKSRTAVSACAAALREAWVAADGVARADQPHPADQAIDNGWAALYGRLEAYARLPAARAPKAVRAHELSLRLFPGGLTFLDLPYVEEWAESAKRLHRIEAEGLRPDIDALCGEEFLAEVRITHEAYGKAIGITAQREGAVDPSTIAEPLRALTRAFGAYAVQLLAAIEGGGLTAAQVKATLAPMLDARARRDRAAAPPGDPIPA